MTRALVLLVALAFLAPAGSAQSGGFLGRDRELMHPGAPLEIVGLEQGDNEIRTGTPALDRSDHRAARVDLDQLYERKLAMYSGRVYAKPPARIDAPPSLAHGDPVDGAPTRPMAVPDEVVDPSGVPWIAMLAAAVFAGSIAAIVVARRNGAALEQRGR